MTRICQAPVRRVEQYGGGNFLLAAEAPEIAADCRPGQFVMASMEEPLLYPSPLLKRALAIYSVEASDGAPSRITLLAKRVGEGTTRLSAARLGDRLSLVGPLGNGFRIDECADRVHVVVAGGIGIASVLLLARTLTRADREVHLVYGARTRRELVGLEDFERSGVAVTTTTDDGSHGLHGLVTDGLRELLTKIDSPHATLYVCGPNPMMQAVAGVAARHRVPCQISVEVKMACGFGVCLGCSVKTVGGYRLACTHGPVFDAESFVWAPAPTAPAGVP